MDVGNLHSCACRRRRILVVDRPPNALERATKIVTVPEWRGANRGSALSYMWLTNGDFLLSKPDERSEEHLFRGSLGKYPIELSPEPPIKMPARIKGFSNLVDIYTSHQFSPDGEWALCFTYSAGLNTVTAFQIRGAKIRVYSFESASSQDNIDPIWSNDGKTIYCFDGTSKKLHRFRPYIDAKETLTVLSLPEWIVGSDVTVLGVLESGRILVQKTHTPTTNGTALIFPAPELIELYEVGYGTDKKRSLLWSMRFHSSPEEVNYPLVLVSPDKKRLFLGIASIRQTPFLEWLHQRFDWIPQGNYGVEQGWVMNLDGSGKHLIGEFTVPMEEGKERPWIVDPKWTPDGKKISFLYDDGIYTIPAD